MRYRVSEGSRGREGKDLGSERKRKEGNERDGEKDKQTQRVCVRKRE